MLSKLLLAYEERCLNEKTLIFNNGINTSLIVYDTFKKAGFKDEYTQTNTSQISELGIGKFSLKYIPNVNNQLDYEILGRLTNESQDQNYLSSVIGAIDQLDDAETFSINQNLNYYYTLNEKNIFALEAQHLIKDEDPFYNAILENNENYQTTATGLGLDNSLPFYNIAQEKKVKSNQLDAKVDY